MLKQDQKIKAIITGSTGMVGEGVLHECLEHAMVESVLIINRKPLGLMHPKLKEIIHEDFFDLSAIKDQLAGYNACYFCLGVTSVGKKEPEYFKLTHTLTMHMAGILSDLNNHMIFCYVSGAGTDSSEQRSSMWARVKGKTENDLMKLPFGHVYAYRPGFIKPTKGLKNTHAFYKFINWLFPLGKAIYPNGFCTLKDLGLSMINVTLKDFPKQVIDCKDIEKTANA